VADKLKNNRQVNHPEAVVFLFSPFFAIMFQRIVPALTVHHLGKTQAFYRDMLGFEIRHLGYMFYAKRNDIEIQFSEVLPGQKIMPSELIFYVDDMEEWYAQLSRLNLVMPKGALKPLPYLPREFHIFDINQHLLRFRQASLHTGR